MERKKTLWVLLSVLVLLMLVVCLLLRNTRTSKQDILPPKIEPKQEIAVCVGPDPKSMDPALCESSDNNTLIFHCFEGLMTRDKKGALIPGVAESCDVSKDGLTYTFKIRKDAKWSDGQPVTALDFVYSWNRAIEPATGAPDIDDFDVIKRKNGEKGKKLDVEAVDDTFVVKLKSVVPYFKELCSSVTFSPVRKDIIEKYGGKWSTDPSTYVCNGPFKMSEWKQGAHIIQKKNEKYWNRDNIKLDSIKFVLMEDGVSALPAFKSGSILYMDCIPPREIAALKGTPEFHCCDTFATNIVRFNIKKMGNRLVRKALTLAVDRNGVREACKSEGAPAGAYVSPMFTDVDSKKSFRDVGRNYYDPDDYGKNLELAKQALVEAGYPKGEGLPRYEYLYNESVGNKSMAESLKSAWEKIGVHVDLRAQDWNTFQGVRRSGNFQITRDTYGHAINDPVQALEMWITGVDANCSRWSNSEYDDLIKQVKASSDAEKRMKLMHQAEDILFDDWALCPVFYSKIAYLVSEKLKDACVMPSWLISFVYSYVV